MSFLNKLIAKKVNGVIKNATKMDIVIDSLIDKFKDQCPPKAELLLIVKQKNQIQGGLEQIISVFEPINTTAQTVDDIVTSVSIAVKVIKAIPVPSSVPPGVGIPINVITILSDSLDQLDKLLSSAKLATATVPPVTKVITDAALSIVAKLQQLDILFDGCIQDLIIDDDLTPSQIQDLALEINNVAATSGNFDNIGLNSSTEANLLNSLSPNSPSQYVYKDFLFEIQYDVGNEFSFPSRRIRVRNINLSDKNVYKGVILYNLEGGRYSFSSSVQVLIDEARFRIDNLNYSFYWKQWVENQVVIEEDLSSSTPPTRIPSSPNPQFPPPNAIVLTPTPLEDFIPISNTLSANFLRQMYASNPYKQIPYSIDIGRAVQATGNNMEFPTSNSLMLTAEVYVPNTELTFTLDTGEFTPKTVMGNSPPGWGIYDPNSQSVPYDRGYAKLKINAASGSVSQDIKYLEGDRGIVSYSFLYPNIGTYSVQVEVVLAPTSGNNSIRANTSSSLIISYNNQ